MSHDDKNIRYYINDFDFVSAMHGEVTYKFDFDCWFSVSIPFFYTMILRGFRYLEGRAVYFEESEGGVPFIL